MKDYEEVLQQAAKKYKKSAALAAQEGILPYKSEGGKWIESPFNGNGWWTGGFWPALMWQLYHLTGDQFYLQEARRVQALLVEEFRVFRHLDHDVGFMYLLSTGADYKLTGDERARWDTLHAASLLMGRFNPKGFIRAWNGPEQVGIAIIDCMMNLSLLFWASRVTGDLRFAHVACAHADTAMDSFVREDGSVRHIVEFDPNTGKMVREYGGQGYAVGTSWSRGQAWGLYGFALAYRNTGIDHYLETSERIAAYFMMHIRPDGLTDCDFCQPAEPERIDNLAGAIAACGYLELYRITQKMEYKETAIRLVEGVIQLTSDFSEKTLGLLTHCTASYHDDTAGVHTNITYGDYFLVEALMKLTDRDPMFWI